MYHFETQNEYLNEDLPSEFKISAYDVWTCKGIKEAWRKVCVTERKKESYDKGHS